MRKFWTKGAAGSLAAACLVLLAGSLARGEDLEKMFQLWGVPQVVQFQVEGGSAEPIEVGDHWIGVLCRPADAVVKSHLKLDHGLVVERVVPDSPAAKAGVEPNVILLSFGEKKLAEVVDLVEAVKAAKDEPTELKFIEAGREQSLKITPAKRPEDDVELNRALTPQEAWKNWMEESLPEGLEGPPLRWRRFRPGILLPENRKRQLELPENVSITITKQGQEKAKVTVTKDGEEFTATEDKLDDLPDDVRPHVAQMLGRGPLIELDFEGFKWSPEDIAKQWPQLKRQWQLTPPQVRVYPGKPTPEILKAERRMREQVEQMRRSLESLQQQLDELHGQTPDVKQEDVDVKVEVPPVKPKP